MVRRFVGLFLITLVSITIPETELFAADNLHARQRETLGSIKQRFKSFEQPEEAGLVFLPVRIQSHTPATIVAPANWRTLSKQVEVSVKSTHAKFLKLFGDIPAFTTTIRLMTESDFFKKTKAPAWTNAMYYHGEILIPIAKPSEIDLENIYRSIRHEYSHAIIHALSDGRCPGWLDEGIAQWAEGNENPALRPALNRWLSKNPPVELNRLQGGFTRLAEDVVPAAYAQSLFATTSLLKSHGFQSMRSYFFNLRSGESKSSAFKNSFKMHEFLFEKALAGKMNTWRKTGRPVAYAE